MAIQYNKIASAIMEFPNGKKIDMAKYINLPVSWESVLDETHGTATVLMTDLRQAEFNSFDVSIETPFKVNTPIEICFKDQTTVIRMVVARDTAEMVRKDSYATWSHNIQFVDEAKLLEQEPVDNLTFKNPVPRNYTDSNAAWSVETTRGANDKIWMPPTLKNIQEKDALIEVSDNVTTFDLGVASLISIKSLTLSVKFPSGATTKISSPLKSEDTMLKVKLLQDGEYELAFELIYTESLILTHKVKYTTYIYAGGLETSAYTPYTIKGVIDRVLDLTPTRTANGTNKYVFRNNAKEYATEESPEFTFTGKHLFEVMLDIANYKKMFPALYKNEIYFRPFWNGIVLTSDNLPQPIKTVINSAIDQYCTYLDSYVENMVCVNDSNIGTVVEPYKDGYVSARSSGGAEISESTAVIATQSPIYQPFSLVVGQAPDKNGNAVSIGDIQAYLYEAEDYEALSDMTASYPYSRAYALKYTRFAKNYTELAHRVKSPSTIADALTKPAFANIVGVAGGSVGMGVKEYLSAFVDESAQAAQFSEVLFQPTYTPIVNARVRQYKPVIDAEDADAMLYYNQQAEVVDSEAFGEHVKGLVQKLGNTTEIRVYRFSKIDEVPSVGTLIDDKSVYNVAVTIYETHVDATICLVDYAELSQFIGVKNEIKTSDISATKWCNRFINWEEFFVFTNDANMEGNSLSVTTQTLDDIVKFQSASPLTCAYFTTRDANNENIVTAFAPVKHLAIGNSIYFQFEMLDNFSVGYQSEVAPDKATSVITGTRYDRAQKAVRYCDPLGRAETIDFKLLKRGATIDNINIILSKDNAVLSVDDDGTLTVELLKAYTFYVEVFYKQDGSAQASSILWPGKTSFSKQYWGKDDKTVLVGVKAYTGSDNAKAAIARTLAHAYPEVPSEFQYNPTETSIDEENRPSFELNELLIKKNSAEALKFAAQYHFRQTMGNSFVIGSGMSNFNSLVGGACEDLRLVVSSKPINRFERHIDPYDRSYLEVEGLPTFDTDTAKNRVKITLPSSVNDEMFDGNKALSWLLVGQDRNGNWQLIFGQTKTGRMVGKDFRKTWYLVPRQKRNEPPARTTWTLSLDTQNNESDISITVNGVVPQAVMEYPKNTQITIDNYHYRWIYLNVNGTDIEIPVNGSYTFTLTRNTTYYVWDTAGDGNTSPA